MNEHELPGGGTPAGEISAPILCPFCGAGLTQADRFCTVCGRALPGDGGEALLLPKKAPFSASWREILAALATYVLAWWYLFDAGLLFRPLDGDALSWGWVLAFVLGFVSLTELLFRRTRRSWESWVWLGCLAVLTVGLLWGGHGAWETWQISLFLHLDAVYWVLCRSGRLAEDESGHLVLLDGLHGFVILPFKHFFLRLRTVAYALGRPFRNRRRLPLEALLWSLFALMVAIGLFAIALSLLTKADAGFDKLVGRVAGWFLFDWQISDFLLKLLFSLPVGQYLYGLIAGSAREDPQVLRDRGRRLCAWVADLRRVPNKVWTVLTAAFCLLYLAFFAVQSRYLFGAFTRTLPEGFIVSQYAREGFFELCRVMALNFALLWLVTRLSRSPVRENRAALLLCLILLVESMLFAVVAFSKLLLYIDCFGFTPLRLQSSWLVCVLFAGCLAAGRTLLTGKKSFRAWLIFSCVTLSLLCLV